MGRKQIQMMLRLCLMTLVLGIASLGIGAKGCVWSHDKNDDEIVCGSSIPAGPSVVAGVGNINDNGKVDTTTQKLVTDAIAVFGTGYVSAEPGTHFEKVHVNIERVHTDAGDVWRVTIHGFAIKIAQVWTVALLVKRQPGSWWWTPPVSEVRFIIPVNPDNSFSYCLDFPVTEADLLIVNGLGLDEYGNFLSPGKADPTIGYPYRILGFNYRIKPLP